MSTTTKKRNNFTTKKINNFIMAALGEMFGNNENATTEVVILAPILVKALNDIENGKIEKQTKASLVNVGDELKNKRKKIEINNDEINNDKETEENMINIHDERNGGNAKNQEKNNDKERE